MDSPPAPFPEPLGLRAARECLAGPEAAGGRVLAAVSGGPDSVALLLLLESARASLPGLRLAVGHFHHGLRGRPADEDLEFCHALAGSLGLPFYEGRGDVTALARREGRGVEAAARKARYEFLLEASLRFGAGAVATGHTQDDQAETVLLRIRRGCGLAGLAGVLPRRPLDPSGRVALVRPLLGVPRAELLAVLRARGSGFRTDETNLDPAFDRNRIRLELLPSLRREFPGIDAALARVASAARELRGLLGGALERGMRRIRPEGGGLLVSAGGPPSPLLSGAVLQEAVRRAGGAPDRLTRGHILALEAMASGTGPSSFSLPGGVAARRAPEGVRLEAGKGSGRAPPIPPAPLPVPGRVEAGARVLSAELGETAGGGGNPDAALPAAGGPERLDADSLAFPLRVRSRRPGDRFHPLGAPGTQRLKEFLRAAGVPEGARDGVPLVEDAAGRIAWVAGVRIAHWARVTPGTRRVLRLAIEDGDRGMTDPR